MSDSLIPSFLMSNVSESLRSLTKNEQCERIAQVTHQKWVTMSDLLRSLTKNERPWANRSGCSPKMSKWVNSSFLERIAHSLRKPMSVFPALLVCSCTIAHAWKNIYLRTFISSVGKNINFEKSSVLLLQFYFQYLFALQKLLLKYVRDIHTDSQFPWAVLMWRQCWRLLSPHGWPTLACLPASPPTGGRSSPLAHGETGVRSRGYSTSPPPTTTHRPKVWWSRYTAH